MIDNNNPFLHSKDSSTTTMTTFFAPTKNTARLDRLGDNLGLLKTPSRSRDYTFAQNLLGSIERMRVQLNGLNTNNNGGKSPQTPANRTIYGGTCPICELSFPGNELACAVGVRCMCEKEEHFMCNECFNDFVKRESGPDRCIANDGKVPGCPFRDCRTHSSKVPSFTEQTIAIHVTPETFETFMKGTKACIEHTTRKNVLQEIEDRNFGDRLVSLRRGIAELLVLKCPNGHPFDYDGCDAISACSQCGHAFCAVCSQDFGVGGDAHDHCKAVHGSYHCRNKAIPFHAPAVQEKIIKVLASESNVYVRTDAVTEIMKRGEFDLWRPHFDFEAIKRAVGISDESPAVDEKREVKVDDNAPRSVLETSRSNNPANLKRNPDPFNNKTPLPHLQMYEQIVLL